MQTDGDAVLPEETQFDGLDVDRLAATVGERSIDRGGGPPVRELDEPLDPQHAGWRRVPGEHERLVALAAHRDETRILGHGALQLSKGLFPAVSQRFELVATQQDARRVRATEQTSQRPLDVLRQPRHFAMGQHVVPVLQPQSQLETAIPCPEAGRDDDLGARFARHLELHARVEAPETVQPGLHVEQGQRIALMGEFPLQIGAPVDGLHRGRSGGGRRARQPHKIQDPGVLVGRTVLQFAGSAFQRLDLLQKTVPVGDELVSLILQPEGGHLARGQQLVVRFAGGRHDRRAAAGASGRVGSEVH